MAAQAYGNERGVSEGVRAAGEIAAVAKRYGDDSWWPVFSKKKQL